jgi:uncharacterized Zn-binding protein involved in type VI secretion
MPGQGRLGDKASAPIDAHGCPACPHPAIGPAIQGSPNVKVNRRPALRVDDPGIHMACCGPNTWTATKGSMTVFINGKAAHRMGDQNRHCGGMGTLIEGSLNVIVGDSGGAGAGGGSGGGTSGAGGGGGASGRSAAGNGGTGAGSSAGGAPSTEAASSTIPPDPPLPPASPTPPGEDIPRTTLEVVVTDTDGKPLSGVRYEVKDPSGKVHEGTTNPEGLIRIDGLDAGQCQVSLPDLDHQDWETS